jgi:hypothetical protein
MLPFDLGVLQMPGCTLYTSAEVLLGATTPGRSASWSLPISASSAGATFFTQTLVLDPSANPLGVGMSNAAAAVLGAR